MECKSPTCLRPLFVPNRLADSWSWTLGQCRPVLAVTVNRFRFLEANYVKAIGVAFMAPPQLEVSLVPVAGGVGLM